MHSATVLLSILLSLLGIPFLGLPVDVERLEGRDPIVTSLRLLALSPQVPETSWTLFVSKNVPTGVQCYRVWLTAILGDSRVVLSVGAIRIA